MNGQNGNGNGNGNGNVKQLLQGIRINVVADLAMIVAVVTLVFWVGRQAERIESVIVTNNEQTQAIADVQQTTTKMSGQMLQMTSASNMSAVEQRLSVAETRLDSQETFQRELKQDMVTRLNRIESKIDQR